MYEVLLWLVQGSYRWKTTHSHRSSQLCLVFSEVTALNMLLDVTPSLMWMHQLWEWYIVIASQSDIITVDVMGRLKSIDLNKAFQNPKPNLTPSFTSYRTIKLKRTVKNCPYPAPWELIGWWLPVSRPPFHSWWQILELPGHKLLRFLELPSPPFSPPLPLPFSPLLSSFPLLSPPLFPPFLPSPLPSPPLDYPIVPPKQKCLLTISRPPFHSC